MADTDSALVFVDGEDLTAKVLNDAFSNLDLRLRAFEGLNLSYQQAIDTLNQFGLQRLNDALQPVYDSLIQLGSLGAVFTTTSVTPNTIGLGTATFVVKPEDKDRFAAAAYISAIEAGSASASVSGPLQAYNRTTGTITILVDAFTGTEGASFSSWVISAGASFSSSKLYVDNAIAALIGSADSFADTLGELEQMIMNNTTAITNNATNAQTLANTAQANATANALALAIALG